MQGVRILQGILGGAHVLVALLLLPAALFLGIITIPIVLPGLIWLAVLGVRLWRPDPKLRRALRVTHTVLAALAVLLVVYGGFCLDAARRSAEDGGGLLGGFGFIPIVMGVLVGSLAVASLWAAQSIALVKTPGAPPG